jgi:hypothetical protein
VFIAKTYFYVACKIIENTAVSERTKIYGCSKKKEKKKKRGQTLRRIFLSAFSSDFEFFSKRTWESARLETRKFIVSEKSSTHPCQHSPEHLFPFQQADRT